MTDFSTSLNNSLHNSLNSLKSLLGLEQVEIGSLKSPLSIHFYEKWLAQNYHGDMLYLQSHLEFKKNPLLLNAELKSVISVAQSYFPAPQPSPLKTPARVALYANNEDYHTWLKQKLNSLIAEIQKQHPNEIFLPYVDSGPLLERDLAYQNGLGWFGKNTCLIHPQYGSFFFVAEILTTLQVTNEKAIEPLPDFCGKCQKCLEVCPTQALVAPKTLKADQCISYLTIESKSTPPIELREKMGDWFFGCDLCQSVCPWNEKIFRKKDIASSNLNSPQLQLHLSESEKTDLLSYFSFLLSASHKQIQKYHLGSPLSRAGAKGLKRNALIVIANKNLIELKEQVQKVKTPELQELVAWTLNQLD